MIKERKIKKYSKSKRIMYKMYNFIFNIPSDLWIIRYKQKKLYI